MARQKGSKSHCSNCGEAGHTKRTCKNDKPNKFNLEFCLENMRPMDKPFTLAVPSNDVPKPDGEWFEGYRGLEDFFKKPLY